MTVTLALPNQNETHRLADVLATHARAGLVLLLDGPVGAGKTTLARRIIQVLLRTAGRFEDVPSPTFTIVQTYNADDLEIWHADLYRLTSTDELVELGVENAFDEAFCLVEWPDRLGVFDTGGLRIDLEYGDHSEARIATLSATNKALEPSLTSILADYQK